MNSGIREIAVLDKKYIILKTLGRGATSTVKLGKEIEGDKMFAIKIVSKKAINEVNMKLFMNELKMLKELRHENIIEIRDGVINGILTKSNGKMKVVNYLVLELATNGELFEYLYFPKKGFGEVIGHYIFTQLIEAVEVTHSSGIVHRDLKTENLMMSEDWKLKIADFGYAAFCNGTKGNGLLTTCLGTVSYAAPEIHLKKPYIGPCVDIFSCGVILFVLVTGKLPFHKATVADNIYIHIAGNDYESFWSLMTLKCGIVSNEFKILINYMLAFEPSQRPSIAEIKSHVWMLRELPHVSIVQQEFQNRKMIVTEIKQMEKIIGTQITQSTQLGTNATYRSSYREELQKYFQDSQSDLRVMDTYVSSSNPYIVKFNEEDPDKVLHFIYIHFLSDSNLKLNKFFNKKFGLKLSLYQEDEDELLLEFSIVLNKWDDEHLIAEFIKDQGDKQILFEEFEKFVTSINN